MESFKEWWDDLPDGGRGALIIGLTLAIIFAILSTISCAMFPV